MKKVLDLNVRVFDYRDSKNPKFYEVEDGSAFQKYVSKQFDKIVNSAIVGNIDKEGWFGLDYYIKEYVPEIFDKYYEVIPDIKKSAKIWIEKNNAYVEFYIDNKVEEA